MVSPKVFGFKTDYQCKKICAEKKKGEVLHFDIWLFSLTVFFSFSLGFYISVVCYKLRQRNLIDKNNYMII